MTMMNVFEHEGIASTCKVLIVDDDADALEEYREIATTLGYACEVASDAYTALKRVADDPEIGIVITDLKMPTIDGLSFLDELDSRFSVQRPIVSVVVTGFSSVEAMLAAMRFNARDFLEKPVTPENLAATLRRAARTWNQLAYSFRPNAKGARPIDSTASGSAAARLETGNGEQPSDSELLSFAKGIVRKRERRGEFLDRELFSDPSWDILLDLTSAKLAGTPVPVSSACAATHLPLSTALRYVRMLVEAGLVRRWKDPADRRRDLLELEDHAMDAMRRYLLAVRP